MKAKTIFQNLTLGAALIAAASFVALVHGCANPPETLLTRQHQTNTVTYTNAQGVAQTTNVIVVTYAPNPAVTVPAAGVGGLFGPQGMAGATALTTALTLWAGWLNRRNKKFSVVTVQAIESIRTALRASGASGAALDAKMKEILSKAHTDAGLAAWAQKIIDEYTGYTTATLPADAKVIVPVSPMSS